MDGCVDVLERRLREAGCEYEILDHQPAWTTQEAAAADRVSGYSFAKTVVVMVDGRPQVHALRAPDHVDLESIRATQGARDVRLAREGEFEHLFPGCDAGAPPPVALVPDVDLRIDRRLLESDQLAFEAGDGTHSIRLRTEDYLRLVGGEVADFADSPRGVGRQRPRPAPFDWITWGRRAALGSGALFSLLVGQQLFTRVLPGRASRSFVLGAAAGAAALALADPNAGARRRHVLRDRSARAMRRTSWWARRRARYWRGRKEGLMHLVQEVQEDRADD